MLASSCCCILCLAEQVFPEKFFELLDEEAAAALRYVFDQCGEQTQLYSVADLKMIDLGDRYFVCYISHEARSLGSAISYEALMQSMAQKCLNISVLAVQDHYIGDWGSQHTGFGSMLLFAVIETIDRYHTMCLTRRKIHDPRDPKMLREVSQHISNYAVLSPYQAITVSVGTKWGLEHSDVELLWRAIMTVVT